MHKLVTLCKATNKTNSGTLLNRSPTHRKNLAVLTGWLNEMKDRAFVRARIKWF